MLLFLSGRAEVIDSAHALVFKERHAEILLVEANRRDIFVDVFFEVSAHVRKGVYVTLNMASREATSALHPSDEEEISPHLEETVTQSIPILSERSLKVEAEFAEHLVKVCFVSVSDHARGRCLWRLVFSKPCDTSVQRIELSIEFRVSFLERCDTGRRIEERLARGAQRIRLFPLHRNVQDGSHFVAPRLHNATRKWRHGEKKKKTKRQRRPFSFSWEQEKDEELVSGPQRLLRAPHEVCLCLDENFSSSHAQLSIVLRMHRLCESGSDPESKPQKETALCCSLFSPLCFLLILLFPLLLSP